MKTFVTSSLLAVLSAVVFGWFLVQQGGEIPRRSPDSYPPMVSGLEPSPEMPTERKVTETTEASGPGEKSASEVAGSSPGEPQVAENNAVNGAGDPAAGDPAAGDPAAGDPAAGDPAVARREAPVVSVPEYELFGPPAPVLPFVMNISAAGEGVTLQGSIPTREVKAEIEKVLAATFAGEELDNRLKFSPETRSGLWIRYLPDFLGRYFQHTGGEHEVTVVDGKLMLVGSVASSESKEALLKWAQPLKQHGLVLEESVAIDESLKGKVTEIPESAQKEKKVEAEVAEVETTETGTEVAEAEVTETEVTGTEVTGTEVTGTEVTGTEVAETVAAVGRGADDGAAEAPEAGVELVYFAPFDEQYEVHTVPRLEASGAAVSGAEVYVSESRQAASAKGEESGSFASEELEAEVSEEPQEPRDTASGEITDDGKPLLIYFDSTSPEIAPAERAKIDIAIKRAQRPRSIVYVTGYSDYRGSFAQNQKLALARANRVKDLIFAGEIAEEVTAEVKTAGDSLSRRIPGKETEEQLRRSRRVVVEVYHLR